MNGTSTILGHQFTTDTRPMRDLIVQVLHDETLLDPTGRHAEDLERAISPGRATSKLRTWLSDDTETCNVVLNDRHPGAPSGTYPRYAVLDGALDIASATLWFADLLMVPASWFPSEWVGRTMNVQVRQPGGSTPMPHTMMSWLTHAGREHLAAELVATVAVCQLTVKQERQVADYLHGPHPIPARERPTPDDGNAYLADLALHRRPAPEPGKTFVMPEAVLGPWYLTLNNSSSDVQDIVRADNPCRVCQEPIAVRDENFFHLMVSWLDGWEDAVMHRTCGHAMEEVNPGLHLVTNAG